MNALRESGMQNRPTMLNTKATPEQQIVDARRSIDQAWQMLSELSENVTKILSVIDFKTTPATLINLINKKNGHSSSMPDTRGENTDHDERYTKRSQYDAKIAQIEERLTAHGI